ncbi:MAG: hypothetical protein ACPL5F_13295 [Moorellaceae bacterium]
MDVQVQLEVKVFWEKDRPEKLYWLLKELSLQEWQAMIQRLERLEPHLVLSAFNFKDSEEEERLDRWFQKRMYLEMTGQDIED